MDSRLKVEDEANSSTAESSTSDSNSILFLGKFSSVPRDPGLCCYNTSEPFSNDDVATEILSRLPTYSLLAFKCTSTKWNKLISDPSFLHIHYKSSYDIVGLFVQDGVCSRYGFRPGGPVHFQSLVDNKCRLNLDFLPNKVVLVGSSNGIICCRTYKYPKCDVYTSAEYFTKDPLKLVIYLCDPARKEWIAIKPFALNFYFSPVFGLVSYPFGTSSSQAPSFKLVNVRPSMTDRNVHSFFIYSSDTGKWKMSNAVCCFGSPILEDMATFANGRLHWSTLDHHMLTFDVESELSKLIKLPRCEGDENWGIRFGESEGYLHCICVLTSELQVWVLKDYDEPAWKLKHRLNLLEFYLQNVSLFGFEFVDILVRNYYREPPQNRNTLVVAWSYYNEVIGLLVFGEVFSYNFNTGRLIKHNATFEEQKRKNYFYPAVIQCHVNLVPLKNFVGNVVNSFWMQGRSAILPCKRPRRYADRA